MQLDNKTVAGVIAGVVLVVGLLMFLRMRSDSGPSSPQEAGMPPNVAAEFNQRMQKAGAGKTGPAAPGAPAR